MTNKLYDELLMILKVINLLRQDLCFLILFNLFNLLVLNALIIICEKFYSVHFTSPDIKKILINDLTKMELDWYLLILVWHKFITLEL